MSGVPGTPYGAHPLAKLDGDVAVGATTIKCDRDLTASGFPASGQIIIDFDLINYTGCSGVVKSHSSNIARQADLKNPLRQPFPQHRSAGQQGQSVRFDCLFTGQYGPVCKHRRSFVRFMPLVVFNR